MLRKDEASWRFEALLASSLGVATVVGALLGAEPVLLFVWGVGVLVNAVSAVRAYRRREPRAA